MVCDGISRLATLYLKGNWEQPERVKLVLMLAEPGRPFGTEHQNRGFQRRIEWFLGECGFDLWAVEVGGVAAVQGVDGGEVCGMDIIGSVRSRSC